MTRPHPRSRDGEAPDAGRTPRGSGPGPRIQLRRPHAGDEVRRRPGLIWDLRAGNVRETLTGRTGPIPTIVASADGRTLYTGGLDKRIIVWDLAGDRRLARSFQVHPFQQPGFSDFPPPLAVSPSGRIVAAGRPDGGVSLHDAHTLRHLRDLPGDDDGPVMAVEFS